MHTFYTPQLGDPDFSYESLEQLSAAVNAYPERFDSSTHALLASTAITSTETDQQ